MIKIQNVYYMLAYAFDSINDPHYKKLGHEDFSNMLDLYGAILSIGINNLIKQGLGRNYQTLSNETNSVYGKINISESIKTNLLHKKKLICERDEFIVDTYPNQVIKATGLMLIKSPEVKNEFKQSLKRNLMFFNHVNDIKINHIEWNQLTHQRANRIYRLIINVCFLAINGYLQNQNAANIQLINFLDNKHLHTLFEKFVLRYYRKHFFVIHLLFHMWNGIPMME